MKKIIYLAFLCLCTLVGCETYPEASPMAPSVMTGEATNCYRTMVTLSGTFSDVASSAGTVEECGILLSVVQSMSDAKKIKTNDFVSNKEYSVTANGLEAGRTYYYQAYAYSGRSTMTGDVMSFTTPLKTVPVLNELKWTKEERNSYGLSTSILDDGGSSIQWRGFCWKQATTSGDPTIENDDHDFVDEVEFGDYHLKGLLPNSKYIVRAFATNESGAGYSNSISFETDKRGEPVFDTDILPWGSPEDIETIVTPEILDSLEQYMPIYRGTTPPYVEGAYLYEPEAVYCQDYATGGGFAPGTICASEIIRLYNQNDAALTLDFSSKSVNGNSSSEGTGSFISGYDNHFTVYFNTEGVSSGIYTRMAEVYSGTITENGISEFYHAFVMVEKGDDPNHKLMGEGVFRLFRDTDGIAKNHTWDNESRSLQSTLPSIVMRCQDLK